MFSGAAFAADTMPPDAEQQLARDIYKEMIEVKSGFTTGTTTPIAQSVAARFKAAGFAALFGGEGGGFDLHAGEGAGRFVDLDGHRVDLHAQP